MKQVTKFESADGKLFDMEQECVEYEKREALLQRIYEDLRNAESEEIYNWIVNNTLGFK